MVGRGDVDNINVLALQIGNRYSKGIHRGKRAGNVVALVDLGYLFVARILYRITLIKAKQLEEEPVQIFCSRADVRYAGRS